MKVLLIKDVYKLGRAGDVKKVADGYGRNFLLPQAMAVLATPGALKQVDHIRTKAAARRAEQNKEMGGLADQLQGVYVTFPTKAGETGKLYGSITTAMIAEALSKKIGTTVERRHVECQPIRNLGKFKAIVRLTVDLNPEVLVIVHREGEVPELPEETKPVDVPVEVPAAE
jgi:large subunit ribosomal protein L9